MWTAEINYGAWIVAALVPLALGFPWYSERLGVGRAWMRAIGKTREQIESEGNFARAMIVSNVGALVQSYLLAQIMIFTAAQGFGEGFVIGIWAALGLVAVAFATSYVFENRPLSLYFINAGYHVIAIPVMAGILAAWR